MLGSEVPFDTQIEACQIMGQDVTYAWIIAVRDRLVYQVVINGRMERLEVIGDEDWPDDNLSLPRTSLRIPEAMRLLASGMSEADKRRINYVAQVFYGPSSIYDDFISPDPMDWAKGLNDVVAHFGRALLEKTT